MPSLYRRLAEIDEHARSLAEETPACVLRIRALLSAGRAVEAFEVSDAFQRRSGRGEPRSGIDRAVFRMRRAVR